jgi:anti-anti-sigma factor
MAPDSPTMTREDRDGCPTLVLVGEFDLAVADGLRAALDGLRASDSTSPTLDLAGVTFMDSSCLGALLDLQRQAHASGGNVVLISPSGPSRRLLEITGVDELFEIRD